MNLIALIFTVLKYVGFVAAVLGLVDVARRKDAVFPAVGKQTKTFWVVVLAVSALAFLLFGPVSLLGLPAAVATIVYFVDVKPAVSEASGGGSSGGW